MSLIFDIETAQLSDQHNHIPVADVSAKFVQKVTRPEIILKNALSL